MSLTGQVWVLPPPPPPPEPPQVLGPALLPLEKPPLERPRQHVLNPAHAPGHAWAPSWQRLFTQRREFTGPLPHSQTQLGQSSDAVHVGALGFVTPPPPEPPPLARPPPEALPPPAPELTHSPPAQVCPPGQTRHDCPCAPQAFAVLVVMHSPFAAQQPVGHEAALHGGAPQAEVTSTSALAATHHSPFEFVVMPADWACALSSVTRRAISKHLRLITPLTVVSAHGDC